MTRFGTFGPVVVAIPARNEAGRIADCLEALNNQTNVVPDHIVLLVNNSTDNTVQIAQSIRLHRSTQLHVIESVLPDARANAGYARYLAMEAAAALAGPKGVLLTTDADGQVDRDWLIANLMILRHGADAVAGWIDLDPIEWRQIPIHLHEDDARECAYDAVCDEIHARLDPDPSDPMPRHTQHSGASIAMTAAVYAACGGLPPVACGEDRALIAALRRIDARIRHAPEVHVSVSGRIVGRSVGGMADTIRRRMLKPDEFLDDRLEPASDCAQRALCHAKLRRVYNDPWGEDRDLRTHFSIPTAVLEKALLATHFGAAWDLVERSTPSLFRRRVPLSDLPEQQQIAENILACIRNAQPTSSIL